RHCRLWPRARRAVPSLCRQGPGARTDVTVRAEVGSPLLEIRLSQEAGARAARQGPANLRFDLTHAGNCDLQPLTDQEVVLGFNAASFLRKIGQDHRLLAAVAAMYRRVDFDDLTVLTPYPPMQALHDLLPTRFGPKW